VVFVDALVKNLLSELRFLGWNDDKIARFAILLLPASSRGRPFAKTEFYYSVRGAMRNTWTTGGLHVYCDFYNGILREVEEHQQRRTIYEIALQY
jgi:hypothetical protein